LFRIDIVAARDGVAVRVGDAGTLVEDVARCDWEKGRSPLRRGPEVGVAVDLRWPDCQLRSAVSEIG
jgi:hypothetical protein